ncbi:MAG: hypothetical protein AAF961_12490, partial [Planctomycetota bacterium]
RMRESLVLNEPEFPAGGGPSRRGRRFGTQLSGNLMEAHFAALRADTTKQIGKRAYFAVTERGVAGALGLDDVTEEASYHVVRGRWQDD